MGNNSQLQLHYTNNTTLHPAVVGDVKDQIATATIATSPKIKGPENPTSQLLPINRNIKFQRDGGQDRQRRWWMIDEFKGCM